MPGVFRHLLAAIDISKEATIVSVSFSLLVKKTESSSLELGISTVVFMGQLYTIGLLGNFLSGGSRQVTGHHLGTHDVLQPNDLTTG